MGLIPEGDAPLTRAEVCQLESRFDSRFEAINARFSTMDRRFTAIDNRLARLEARIAALQAPEGDQ